MTSRIRPRLGTVRPSVSFDPLEARRLLAFAYGIVDLAPDTDGAAHTGRAYGISNDGTKIAMQYDGHAAVRRNGVVTDFGFAGYATDVNNNGVVCGVDTSDGQTRPFVWKDGVKTLITADGQTQGVANAINANNTVVGRFGVGSLNDATPFYSPLGQPTVLMPILGFTGGEATGVNDKGQIVGNSSNPGPSGQTAFIYADGNYKNIDVSPDLYGDTVIRHGLTNDGVLAFDGTTRVDDMGSYRYPENVFTVGSNGYGTPSNKGKPAGTTFVNTRDINAANQIVGAAGESEANQAFARIGDSFVILQNTIDPAKGWSKLTTANAIADGGKIVGFGVNNLGQVSPYLLEPIVAPATFNLSGKVWNDTDGDGVFDANESVSGVRTVYIDANANGKLDSGEKSTQSFASGEYVFKGLANGSYKIARVLPSGYHLSNGTGGATYVVAAISGANKTGVNLGSAANTISETASITGVLFDDADKDGLFDDNEARTGIRTVFIDANGNKKLDSGEKSVQSNVEGRYTFTGLTAGTYRITRVFPSGFKLSNNADGFVTVIISAGQVKTGVNLGSKPA